MQTPVGVATATRVTQTKGVFRHQTVGSPIVRTLISAMSSKDARNWSSLPPSDRKVKFEQSNEIKRSWNAIPGNGHRLDSNWPGIQSLEGRESV